MDYVVRILDSDGKLKKERIMFYAVRILDSNGNLKKVVKSKLLSRRHWKVYPEYFQKKRKRKNNFNSYSRCYCVFSSYFRKIYYSTIITAIESSFAFSY